MNPNKETINRKYLMPFVNSCFEKGDAHSAIEAMTDCKMRKIAWAEYYYFTGHTEGASERAEKLLEEPDFAARFSGYMIYGFANLTLGRVQETQRMLAMIRVGQCCPLLRSYTELSFILSEKKSVLLSIA